MKASTAIKLALTTNYGIDFKKGNEIYMCHALKSHDDIPVTAAYRAMETFTEILQRAGTNCLTVYLKNINYKGRYKKLVGRYGHETPCTLKLRVEWWNDHIAMLEAKGL